MASPIDTSMLQLAYQPIVSLKEKHHPAIAFESLLRIRKGGDVHGPVSFLRDAEINGSIVAVDRWVLRQVIQLACEKPNLTTWINASQISIADPNFLVAAVTSMAETNTLGRVTFEITETADVHQRLLAKRLSSIVVSPFTVVIDDVRDGFAKRQLLGKSYVSGCKLSRETTREMVKSLTVRQEVQQLVKTCRRLGKNLVIEGIENVDELQMALSLDISIGQGYLFCRPSPVTGLQTYSQMKSYE